MFWRLIMKVKLKNEVNKRMNIKSKQSFNQSNHQVTKKLRNLDRYYNPILYTQEKQADLLLLLFDTVEIIQKNLKMLRTTPIFIEKKDRKSSNRVEKSNQEKADR